jgi:urease accessory protein
MATTAGRLIAMRTAMADPTRFAHSPDPPLSGSSAEALLKLLTFLSPAFPVGSFSYSHGLEWLIEQGSISSAEALQAWLVDLLEVGGGWNDAVLFAEAYRAAADLDDARLLAVAELAEALAPSAERQVETMAQGRAFLAAVAAAWPCGPVERLATTGGAAYPVAVAAASAGHGIGLDQALAAYLNAFAANLVSVGVRLVPLGQTAGLKIMAALHPVIAATSERALRSSLEKLGSAAVLSDIASMRHEEQYSRVFRT